MLSKPFKHLNKYGYSLIEFLTDVSRYNGDPPEFIYVINFDGMHENHIGVFIFNEIDRNYYRVDQTGAKPKYTLNDCFSLTDVGALRNVSIHSIDIIQNMYNLLLKRKYNLSIDLPRYRRWIEKYKPNRYK